MSFGRGVGNVLLKSNVKSNGKSGIQQSMIKAYVFTGNTPVHTHNVCTVTVSSAAATHDTACVWVAGLNVRDF